MVDPVRIAVFAWIGLTTALAQQTDNHELRAVPAPKNVSVDGRLEEWDLSGEILMCYDLGTLLATHSVRAAAMFDKDRLYLSFRFKDRSPMLNRINPQSEPLDGWRGDSVELRAMVDGRTIHFQCWYFTDANQPVVQLYYGLGKNAADYAELLDTAKAGAASAFQKDADGSGYIQEIAIPWKILTKDGRSLHVGEEMRLGIQVNWGDAAGGANTGKGMPAYRLVDLVNPRHPQRSFFWKNPDAWGTLRLMERGKLEPAASVKLVSDLDRLQKTRYGTQGPVAIQYEIPADGSVTLVMEKPDGSRVRNLIGDYPRKAGKNTDYWDGTDDEGRMVAPGAYRMRGLYHGELDVLYEFSYGSPGDPPWTLADSRGGWLSNHCNPMAVLADEERVYVAAPECEGPHPLIALDYGGNKVWGGLARWYAGFMARSETYLYTVNDKDALPARKHADLDELAEIELIRLDPRTGQMVNFPDGKTRHVIATWNLHKEGAVRRSEGWTIANRAHNADWCGTQAQGLAYLNGTLFVSLHFSDKLLKVDEKTGKVAGEIPLADPSGLAADGKRLLAVSGTRVVSVDPQTGSATPVVTDGLKAPVGLAVDRQGQIYVSDWADQMCVKVFSPDGKFLRHIGKQGGRPWVGAYDPQGMLLPRGIAVDGRGRLWVAEDDFSPRRVSCWNPDGTLAIEKLGTSHYAGAGCYIFPDRPDQGIVLGNLIELDWKSGQWRVLSTLWRSTHPDAELGLDYYSSFSRVITFEGRRFLVHSSRRQWGGPVIISELKGDRAIPRAAIGTCSTAILQIGQQWHGGCNPSPIFADHLWTEPAMNRAARQAIPWFFDGPSAGGLRAVTAHLSEISQKARLRGKARSQGPNANFVWSDRNGNEQIDSDEIRYYATPGLEGPLPAPWKPEQWSCGVADDKLALYLSAVQDGKSYHYRLPVSRWAESGAPVYEPEKAELILSSPYLGLAAWLNERGELLTYGNLRNPARKLTDPLVMYKPDGAIAWTYPSDYSGVHGSHTAPKERRGLLIGSLGVYGTAQLQGVGQIFAFHNNVGQAVLFTADGLYISALFRDGRSAAEPWPDKPARGMSLKDTTNGGEYFGGQFFQRQDTGEVYVVGGRQAASVCRVQGLETLCRLPEQTVQFSASDYDQSQKLLADRTKKQSVQDRATLTIQPLAKPAGGLPDAGAFDWQPKASAQWRYDAARSASAAWTFDDKHLYLCFRDVKDDSPMVNSAQEPQELFKFGDAVAFELRTRAGDETDGVIEGDLRLLLSTVQGKPVAVLYRYVLPGASNPVLFKSVTTTKIDDVKVLEDARVVIDREPAGYTLRAAVPLSAIGFRPEPGKTYRGDFGVIYSDKAGTINELRTYWANKATGLVSDTSLEAQIAPRHWGQFEIPAAKRGATR